MLASFLKPGGSLLIADILNESTDTNAREPELLEKYKHIVAHTNGFTESRICDNMTQAGLVHLSFKIVTTASFHGRDVKFFLARGIKPGET